MQFGGTMPIADERLLILLLIGCVLAMAGIAGRVMAERARSDAAIALARNWKLRVRSWALMIGVGGGALLLGPMALLLLFAGISFLALREYMSTASTTAAIHGWVCAAFLVVLPLQYLLLAWGKVGYAMFAVPLWSAVLLPVVMAVRGEFRSRRRQCRELGSAMLVCIYGLSFPMALMMSNGSSMGVRASLQLVFLLVVSQGSDVFQFVVGKAMGKRPVAPHFSPHKTLEGLIGGLIGASVLGAGLWWLTPYPAWQACGFALLIAIGGFVGGLILSGIKRERGIKDWGSLLPGHGGMLDRVDSLWLSAPLYFLATRWTSLG